MGFSRLGGGLLRRKQSGLPASRSHAYGWEAEVALEAARGHVVQLLGADAASVAGSGAGWLQRDCAGCARVCRIASDGCTAMHPSIPAFNTSAGSHG